VCEVEGRFEINEVVSGSKAARKKTDHGGVKRPI